MFGHWEPEKRWVQGHGLVGLLCVCMQDGMHAVQCQICVTAYRALRGVGHKWEAVEVELRVLWVNALHIQHRKHGADV